MNKDILYKKINVFQKVVDNSIDNLKRTCETMNDEDNEYVSFDACDFIDALVSVKVSDVKDVNGVITLLVVIKYKNYRFMDEETFLYELKNELKSSLGINVGIEVEDTINTFPPDQRNW